MRIMLACIQSRTFCFLVCYTKTLNIETYKTENLPVVACGYETWCLSYREQGCEIICTR
jgi:hypothetical protein